MNFEIYGAFPLFALAFGVIQVWRFLNSVLMDSVRLYWNIGLFPFGVAYVLFLVFASPDASKNTDMLSFLIWMLPNFLFWCGVWSAIWIRHDAYVFAKQLHRLRSEAKQAELVSVKTKTATIVLFLLGTLAIYVIFRFGGEAALSNGPCTRLKCFAAEFALGKTGSIAPAVTFASALATILLATLFERFFLLLGAGRKGVVL
jgi:hypothetical protein